MLSAALGRRRATQWTNHSLEVQHPAAVIVAKWPASTPAARGVVNIDLTPVTDCYCAAQGAAMRCGTGRWRPAEGGRPQPASAAWNSAGVQALAGWQQSASWQQGAS